MKYTVELSAQAFALAATTTAVDPTRPYLAGVSVRRPHDPNAPGLVLTGTCGKVLLTVYDETALPGNLGADQTLLLGVQKKTHPSGAEIIKNCHGQDPRTLVIEVDEETETGMFAAEVFETLPGGTENPVYISPMGIEMLDAASFPDPARVIPTLDREAEDKPGSVEPVGVQDLAALTGAVLKVSLEGKTWHSRKTGDRRHVAASLFQPSYGGPVAVRWNGLSDHVVGVLMPRRDETHHRRLHWM